VKRKGNEMMVDWKGGWGGKKGRNRWKTHSSPRTRTPRNRRAREKERTHEYLRAEREERRII
jgi:hypothetical protein